MDTNDILEEKDGGPEVQINFPESVMSRIEELMGETEQFDSAEFDAVTYINRMFPTEQSLSGVEAATARCEWRLAAAARGLRGALRGAPARGAGKQALGQARGVIGELALQVADINKRAERSESMVREITSEIKQLDRAKANLTHAITALNHYHMLAGGVDALSDMTDRRRYKEIALPLQAIMEVLQHFECYRDIRELNALRDRVHGIRAKLANQIFDDVKEAFTGGRVDAELNCGGVTSLPANNPEAIRGRVRGQLAVTKPAGSKSTISHKTVSEACAVLDILDHKVKQKLLAWFIDTQLQEYQHLFSSNQEVAWLPHVDKRYTWLKKHLLALEQRVTGLLPPQWAVSERIASRFCEITRDELTSLMSSRRSELDVKLLLFAIQKTDAFELLLHKRFNGSEPEGAEVAASTPEKPENDTEKSGNPSQYVWIGAVSTCFEPHLPLYIASLDQSLKTLMDRLIQEAREGGTGDSTSAPGCVLASCADLFLLYKKCLVQCARLSTGEPMLQLCGVFQKHLSQYCRDVLAVGLPRGGAGSAGGNSLVGNLQGLLRDEQANRFTKQEISKITSIITTSEYCLETTVHLEHKLKEKINPSLAERIDLSPERDLFHKMIGDCIQMLVHDAELACEPALQAMTKISWLHFDVVGDQSSYVTQIIMHLRNVIPALRDNLSSSRKYFTQFCIRFANSFIPKFIQNVYKCKPISTVGSEQLLLDTHMLKTALLELPSIGSEVKRPAPQTYTKVVIKLMTKAEMILKLVMAPLDGNVEGFVQQFVQLLPESTLAEFHKVLDMKGAKFSKAQQSSVDTMFKEMTRSASGESK